MMHWYAYYENADGDYMEVYIEHTPDHYNEDYGIMVTSEMEARRLAERQNQKTAERLGRAPYQLVTLEVRD